MAKLSAVAKRRTARRERAVLMLDDNLRVERDRAHDRMLAAARMRDEDEARRLAEEVADLERQMDDASVEFVFEQADKTSDFWDVYNAHPPRDADKKVGLTYNFESILAPLMKLCLVEPEPDDEGEIDGFVDTLSLGQREILAQAAVAANIVVGDVGKSGAAYALIAGTRGSQAGRSTTASPGRTSTADRSAGNKETVTSS